MKKRSPLLDKLTQPQNDKKDSALKRAGGIIWRSLKKTCMALGVLTLIYIVIALLLVSQFTRQSAPSDLPPEMVVYLNLKGKLQETHANLSFFDSLDNTLPSLFEITQTLSAAAKDDRVKGLYVRMGGFSASLSQVQELRAAVKAFRKSGKFAYIYANSFDAGISKLYLASAFDQRWMQPMGVVSIEGLRVEMPFFRAALGKLGITPNFYQRKEYKTAYESLTHTKMSPSNRQSLKTVVSAIENTITADMPSDLAIAPEAFDNHVDQGLFTAKQALDTKLITHLGYPDEILEVIKLDTTGSKDASDAIGVPLPLYRAHIKSRAQHPFDDKPSVALIYVSGAIVENNDAGRDNIAAAREIAPAIWDAGDNPDIQTILLRIDSPGGSPIASETILRAIQKAQEKGKKIVVSMGSMAASGGYWIASGADTIFALPTTMTGSIGVLGGKIALDQMWGKLDVHWDRSIKWGDNAGFWSPNQSFTPAQRRGIDAMLDQIYDGFIQRVAAGRKMERKQAEKLARGRVWPGVNAKANGLVDELGGLEDALNFIAREHYELDDASQLRVLIMPKALSPIEQITKLLGEKGLIYNALKLQTYLGYLLTNAPALEKALSEAHLMNQNTALIYEPTRPQ